MKTVPQTTRGKCRAHYAARDYLRLVMWTLYLSGCSSLSTTLRDDDESSHRYSVDLNVDDDQLSADDESGGEHGISTAHADYSTVRPRKVSQQDEGAATVGKYFAGHSFAPRRATLRRPIPLTDDAVDTPDHATPVTTHPSSASVDSSTQAPSPESNSPSTGSDDRFWSSGGGVSAWQPNAKDSRQKNFPPRLRLNTSRPGHNQESSESTSANDIQGPGQPILDADESVDSRKNESSVFVPSGERGRMLQDSLSEEFAPSSQSPLNEKTTESDSAANSSSVTPTERLPEAALLPESDSTESPPPEQGMLDRIRGLYTPRPSDTERFRKQMRRLSDPFGLLKERDEDAGPSSPINAAPQDQTAEISPTGEADNLDLAPEIDIREFLDNAIAQAEADLENWPRTPGGRPDRSEEWRRRQTDLRLMYLLVGRPADAIRIIESLPEEEQEFWQSLMLAIHSYRSDATSIDSESRLEETLDHVRTAEKRLQPLAQLKIRKAIFCERIDGFGQVTEFPASDFDPGQRVLIYVDVRNFRNELTAGGRFRSEFDAVIEYLREDDKEVVDTIQLPQILDECDVERTDYFQSFELTIPSLAGRYIARVRLKDLLNQQTTDVDLAFTVRSQQSRL